MNIEQQVATLLQWRATRAQDEAPPPPRAAHLLALAQPWWTTWPEQFQRLSERLSRIPVAYGHAMANPPEPRRAHPVPALIVRGDREIETSACVLYLSVRDGRLRVRFQLSPEGGPTDVSFEVTFVSPEGASPFFAARAARSVDHEYSLDAEIPAELARNWLHLKVTDVMPFRLILRTTIPQ
jgi:hypothetical protein